MEAESQNFSHLSSQLGTPKISSNVFFRLYSFIIQKVAALLSSEGMS